MKKKSLGVTDKAGALLIASCFVCPLHFDGPGIAILFLILWVNEKKISTFLPLPLKSVLVQETNKWT